MDYKRNHFIPTALIKYWIIEDVNGSGIYVYDIAKKINSFVIVTQKENSLSQ